jgi:hypothetical protein
MLIGLWGSEDPDDPIVTKSRTGFIITLAGCPLLWVSKLQTETSVRTMMAEYVALSTAMIDLLPLKRLVKVVAVKTPANPNGEIDILKIETTKQLVNIMTKGLVADKFTPLRDALMGWDLTDDGTPKLFVNLHLRGSVENVSSRGVLFAIVCYVTYMF